MKDNPQTIWPPKPSAFRRVAEWGGYNFNPAIAYLLAVWATHALLRAVLLFRSDAYGFPFVGKPDWYIFHALAVDELWILGWSAPALALMIISGAAGKRRTGRMLFLLLAAFHSLLLIFTVLDQETQRFLGMHLDPSLMETYGNPASVREIFKYVSSDLSIRYLPYVLFFGCVPLSWLLYAWFRLSLRWASQTRLGWAVPAGVLASALLSYVFLNFIWTGGFRLLKLQPFPATVWHGLSRPQGGKPVDLALLGGRFRDLWMRQQGDSAFVFPDPAHPYYKVTLSEACAAPGGVPPRCGVDADRDGNPPASDCDDGDPAVHAGAVDMPGNGRDEDCNGVDSLPRNIVFIILESHRAVNVGFLAAHGAKPGATPFLDSLAEAGHAWTRFSAAGVPTINALMAVHLSVLQHPTRYIANDFTTLRQRSFPEALRRRGYRTRFFSAADPAWDGQVPWLRQWYREIDYDRMRETDESMFSHAARWMRDSLPEGRPFLVTLMSKTNHYPFNSEPGVRRLPEGASLQDKMRATMEYTDACLRRFVASLRGEPWFGRTLFIVMADHGFPLSEHGSSTIGYGLYSESTWIPFVIAGSIPRLGKPGFRDYPAGQLDIAPTLLDLAGIREANHFMGHSLLRPAAAEQGFAVLVRAEQGVLEQGAFRIHGPLGELPREQGPEVFNGVEDRLEKRNLYPQAKAVYDSLLPWLQDLGTLNTYLVENNALWPEAAAGPPEPVSVLDEDHP